MQTFKQYMIDEMVGEPHVGFRSRRTDQFNSRLADKAVQPIIHDADMLLRRKDRMKLDAIVAQANEILRKFVDNYEKLGDEATPLKAKIANKYTQVKQLLDDRERTIEDCVQMVQQISNIIL